MHKEETGGERPHSVSEGMAVLTCSQTLACTHSGFHGNMCMKVSQMQEPPSQDWRKAILFPSGLQVLGHKNRHKHHEDRQTDRPNCQRGVWTDNPALAAVDWVFVGRWTVLLLIASVRLAPHQSPVTDRQTDSHNMGVTSA